MNSYFDLSRQFVKKYPKITPGEQRIIEFVLQGLTSVEIGKKLFISPVTVKNNVFLISQKTKMKGREGILAEGIKLLLETNINKEV